MAASPIQHVGANFTEKTKPMSTGSSVNSTLEDMCLEWGTNGVAVNVSLFGQLLSLCRIEQPDSFRWNAQSSH